MSTYTPPELIKDFQEDPLISIEKAATLLSVSKQTLRNWEHGGKLHPSERTKGGHRRYKLSEINNLRKSQMAQLSFLIQRIKVADLLAKIDDICRLFDPLEDVEIECVKDDLNGKVHFNIRAKEGDLSVSQSMKIV